MQQHFEQQRVINCDFHIFVPSRIQPTTSTTSNVPASEDRRPGKTIHEPSPEPASVDSIPETNNNDSPDNDEGL